MSSTREVAKRERDPTEHSEIAQGSTKLSGTKREMKAEKSGKERKCGEVKADAGGVFAKNMVGNSDRKQSRPKSLERYAQGRWKDPRRGASDPGQSVPERRRRERGGDIQIHKRVRGKIKQEVIDQEQTNYWSGTSR